mmetsp:Transcript_91649/g.230313  ORF Transcript_91649/g.230313 Transcript_91649/m.230313 type:complete len:94 (-) Transcript_91649:49-330(-)|eukprot:CAMPEP_0115222316 /NCGR_PEP_ID=MMETSP0270-20121206/28432_1 /TAXON_ID=71861 /ORGANISM="Scrippsiella trochoidea, Strain CCMP3099" /LENGTH=93 /DNA_ID=CAMNT_0002636463 /DNA_START=97 /DNA_END=378 /DNA_ORIENTATION=+
MDVSTQAAMKVDLANKDFGGEDPVYCIGNSAYVPRLVQANIPWTRPPVTQAKFSTKKDGGSSLRSLGSEVYQPSGLALRAEEPLEGLVRQSGK